MDRPSPQNAEDGAEKHSSLPTVLGMSQLDSDLLPNLELISKGISSSFAGSNTSTSQTQIMNNFLNNEQPKAAIGTGGTNVTEMPKENPGPHLSFPVTSSIAALHMHLLSSPPVSQSTDFIHEDSLHSMMLDASLLTSPDNRSIQQAVNAALFSLDCDTQHPQGEPRELDASSVKCNLSEIMERENTNILVNGECHLDDAKPGVKQFKCNISNTGMNTNSATCIFFLCHDLALRDYSGSSL